MATVMTSASTLDASGQFSIRLRQKERNYWMDLTEDQRASCLGSLTQLAYASKTVWGVTGCLQEYWKEEVGIMIRNVCSNEKNRDRIYRKDSLHPTCTSQLFLLGHANAPEAAMPTVVIVCTSRRIANATRSLLRNHESIKKLHLGFDFLIHKERIQLLAGADSSFATSKPVPAANATRPFTPREPTAHFASICGSRFITCPVPANETSKWKQATMGGILTNSGQWYGLTVAHVFLELPEFELSDSESTTSFADEDDNYPDATKESSGNDDDGRSLIGLLSRIPARHGVYLESMQASDGTSVNSAFPVLAPARGSVLSLIGHFNCQLQEYTKAINIGKSRFHSVDLDWALIEIEDTRLMVPNEISTGKDIVRPSLLRPKKGPPRGKVLIAGGITGVGDAMTYGDVAYITLPWSTTAQEVWTLSYKFEQGDCGAWVLDPEDGGIYGVAIAAVAGTDWTYVLPAENVMESLEANWATEEETRTGIFGVPNFQEPGNTLLRPSFRRSASSAIIPAIPSRPANLLFRSCLSKLAQGFASIPTGHYAQCSNFMLQHPAIFFEDRARFVEETVLALRAGEYEYARSCAQQALLLGTCEDMTLKEILRFFDQLSDINSQLVQDTIKTLDAVISKVEERLFQVQDREAAAYGSLITRTGTAQSKRSVDEVSVSTGKETAESRALVFTRAASISTRATSSAARPRSVTFQMRESQLSKTGSERDALVPRRTDLKSRPALSRTLVSAPIDPYPSRSEAFGAALVVRDRLFAPTAVLGPVRDIVRAGTLELFLQRLHEAADVDTEGNSR